MKLALITLLVLFHSLTIAAPEQLNASHQGHAAMKVPKELFQAYLAKGLAYRPRTEHFNDDGTPTYINHLILEDSPYLLQHAHNPVDWLPWGKEAFEKAKRENKN